MVVAAGASARVEHEQGHDGLARENAIKEYLEGYEEQPKPFTSTEDTDQILETSQRCWKAMIDTEL